MSVLGASTTANPREKTNFFGVLLWTWTINFFRVGYTKVLGKEDLYDPLKRDNSKELGDKLEKLWMKELDGAKKGNRTPSLTKVLFFCFSRDVLMLGFLQIINEFVLRLGTPILIGQLLRYFREEDGITYNEAIAYAIAVCVATGIFAIATNQWLYLVYHIGGRMRIAVCSVVYRKALRLDMTTLGETTSGKIVNLLANDVNRLDLVLMFIHFLWSGPLAAIIVGYFLWNEAGYSGLIGIAAIFIIVPIQSYTGKLSAKFRLQTTVKTDQRVRLMNEIVSGVQVIKMYAWEKPFCQMIALIRKLELNRIRMNSWIHGAFMTMYLFLPRTALYCTIVGMILFGQKLSVDTVFVFFSYFSVLSEVLGFMFARGISEIAQCTITVKRLQEFLMTDEFKIAPRNYMITSKSKRIDQSGIRSLNNNEIEQKHIENNGKLDCIVEQKVPIKLTHLSAKWSSDTGTELTLDDISIDIERGKMYVMIGAVGSGKSSFISSILGELTITQGYIDIEGSISYASQEAWIFGSTVRQNILFGQPFDSQRYQEVVSACALLSDFEQFPQGDQTILGERGSSLSGGQKARINLARCVYRQSDIYIFDDPLSAVDTQVGKHLFEECFTKYLDKTTRILVTHQLQHVTAADVVLLMEHGKLIQFQDYNALLLERPEYSSVLASESTSEDDLNGDEKVTTKRFSNAEKILKNSSELLQDDNDSEDDEEGMKLSNVLEKTSRGTVKGFIFMNYLTIGNSWLLILAVFGFLVITQCAVTAYDMFFPGLVASEEKRFDEFLKSKENNTLEDNGISNEYSTTPAYESIYIYTGITIAIFIFGITQSTLFYVMCLNSSEKLHNKAFSALIRTGMKFFSANSSGRILNRFSKDIDAIDDLLPKTLDDAIVIIMIACGVIVITCSINPIFIAPLIIIAYGLYWLTKIYMRTSKNVKRLEGIMRSPVFTHLNVTMNGLMTIRAFGAQDLVKLEFDRFQDGHTSAWYMFIATSNAFGFALDVFCFIFTAIVTFGLLIASGYSGAQVGLSITSVISMTSLLQWGVRQSAEVVNQMMSVERVLEYTLLTPEENLLNSDSEQRSNNKSIVSVANEWPKDGCVAFKNVVLKYSDDAPPVLKNINFVIKPKEKVGIVGRTGAGKSSLISALFRLTKIEGSIEIDGIDTASVSLHDLRRRIAIIPQEPVLFSGSLRRNLDPFDDFSDHELWAALEEVELKEAIAKETNGLDTRVVDRGGNFSVGQRQLVCLARAILRNNKILVLDEATANVDPHTDNLIQKTIRTKFTKCTVLTIAHRLNTIMDSDKIIVMDNGYMVEFDHPHLLLQNENGKFVSLVQETGQTMSNNLFKIAREAYEEKNALVK